MNKHYSSYRGRRTRKRGDEGGGWKRMCFFGVLVGLALMCNVFFHDQVEALRNSAAGAMERGGYTQAMTAIGGALSGKKSFSGAWSEAVAAISRQGGADAVTASAAAENLREPSASAQTPRGTGKYAFEMLENGIHLPDDGGGVPAGYTFDPDESIMTFDFLEIPDTKEVSAYKDGTVIADGDSEIYGKYLIIDHGGLTAQYFHCGTVLVRSGDAVTAGQIIASGN